MTRSVFSPTDVPVESLRLRFALLQSLNNTLENFFLPLVELRQTQTYRNSIAALLCEAKGQPGIISCPWQRTWLQSKLCPSGASYRRIFAPLA